MNEEMAVTQIKSQFDSYIEHCKNRVLLQWSINNGKRWFVKYEDMGEMYSNVTDCEIEGLVIIDYMRRRNLIEYERFRLERINVSGFFMLYIRE
jgi:hypothetical protein